MGRYATLSLEKSIYQELIETIREGRYELGFFIYYSPLLFYKIFSLWARR